METVSPPPIVSSQEAMLLNSDVVASERESKLRALLDPPIELQKNGETKNYGYGNYEFALESGLIDMFYFNPETGEDGLIHTLAGEAIEGADGSKVVEGFHHESSGKALWPTPEPKSPDETPLPPTRVDRDHNKLNSAKKKEFREFPFEPYRGKVFIDNAKKLGEQKDPDTGETKVVEIKNGMYPKEYDALTVMQAIRIAYKNRNQGTEKQTMDDEGRPVLVSESYAPMLDGGSLFKIRMVLDPETEKIRTAVPVMNKPGIMKLSRAAINEHLGL